jgi:hypothetical protein
MRRLDPPLGLSESGEGHGRSRSALAPKAAKKHSL